MKTDYKHLRFEQLEPHRWRVIDKRTEGELGFVRFTMREKEFRFSPIRYTTYNVNHTDDMTKFLKQLVTKE